MVLQEGEGDRGRGGVMCVCRMEVLSGIVLVEGGGGGLRWLVGVRAVVLRFGQALSMDATVPGRRGAFAVLVHEAGAAG